MTAAAVTHFRMLAGVRNLSGFSDTISLPVCRSRINIPMFAPRERGMLIAEGLAAAAIALTAAQINNIALILWVMLVIYIG